MTLRCQSSILSQQWWQNINVFIKFKKKKKAFCKQSSCDMIGSLSHSWHLLNLTCEQMACCCFISQSKFIEITKMYYNESRQLKREPDPPFYLFLRKWFTCSPLSAFFHTDSLKRSLLFFFFISLDIFWCSSFCSICHFPHELGYFQPTTTS